MTYPDLRMIIDGEAIGIGHRRAHTVLNPATGTALGALPLADAADLDRALAAAERGFRIWRDVAPQQRTAVLSGAARLLMERQEAIARIATLEEGKTLAETRLEVQVCSGLFSFYAGECQRVYGRRLARPPGVRATVTFEPVGPVAAFAPWNFPVGNPGRKLGAPIAAGCSVILKAAEEAPASALAVLQCLLDAGLPKEVGQAVFGIPEEVSRHLLGSPMIRKLSFTGSTAVGKHLMKLAAEDCKRTTMELGGHAPVLIFDDIDVEHALTTLVASKFRNAGQTCVSPTRFIVHKSVFTRIRDGFADRAAALRVGDGLEDGVQMGPLANSRRLDAMDRLIGGAVAAGAKLHTGGHRLGKQGFFYAPSVLSEVPLTTAIMNEEPFGPVALINPFNDEADMIAEANRLPYGLAAYSWTNDARRQKRLARDVETGMFCINTATLAAPDTPFGGVKWSGHGHEDGPEGVMECMVLKTVHEA